MHFCPQFDLRNEKGSGAEMCPKLLLDFWNRYRERVGQLLAKYFPVLKTVPEVIAKKK